jgi:hypothetical protein
LLGASPPCLAACLPGLPSAPGDRASPPSPSRCIDAQVLEDGLEKANVPYAYGFAIILLTLLVKGATYPLSRKSVSSQHPQQSWGRRPAAGRPAGSQPAAAASQPRQPA